MKKILPLIIILYFSLFTISSSFSQFGAIEWEKTYGMAGGDAARDIIQTNDGGYIFTGRIEDSLNTASYHNLWVMKIDANGDSLWSNAYKTGGYQSEGQSILQTSDGGYIVTGRTRLNDMVNTSMVVIKITSDGTKEWQKIVGSDSFQDEGYKVIETYDKAFLICGYTMTYAIGNSDGWLLKLDSLGNEIWNTVLGDYEWDFFADVKQTDDNSLVAVGYKNGFDNTTLWIVKFNSEGIKIWEKEYSEGGSSIAYTVDQTADNGYIVSGKSQIASGETVDYYILKLDEFGDSLWTRTYGNEYANIASSLQIVSGGGYIIAGQTYGVPSNDMWVLRVAANGDSLWSEYYGGAYYDDADKILQIADGGYVLAGVKGVGGTNFEACVIKIAPDIGAGIYKQRSGNSIELTNYPNPFLDKTNITFEIKKEEHVKLSISDMSGRQIEILVDQKMSAGNHNFEYKAKNLRNGMYFVHLQAGNMHYVKQIIKTN